MSSIWPYGGRCVRVGGDFGFQSGLMGVDVCVWVGGGGGGGGFWVITCMFPSCLNSMGMGLCVLLCYEHM